MSSTQTTSSPSHGDRAEGDMPGTSQGARGIRRAALSVGTRIFNPLVRRLAGSRALPFYAVVQHQGRRSGRSYATPVVAQPTADGFIIPLAFGERADWFRNVRAAGGCRIRWHGADYLVVEPTVVDWATARSAFTPRQRALAPLFGAERFVRLRRAAPASEERP